MTRHAYPAAIEGKGGTHEQGITANDGRAMSNMHWQQRLRKSFWTMMMPSDTSAKCESVRMVL
jgi:hypothetical protein